MIPETFWFDGFFLCRAAFFSMAFVLTPLPYRADSLSPTISEETISFHYGKHHATYVKNLNMFVEKDFSLAGKTLVSSFFA